MAVKFKVLNREVHVGKEVQNMRFAQIKSGQRVSLEELSHFIGRISAMSSGDVMSVLHTTADLVAMNLQNGRPVSLGDLGSLRLSLKSNAVLVGEKFDASNIERGRILFVPGRALRKALKDLRFQLDKSEEGLEWETPSPTPNPNPTPDPDPTPDPTTDPEEEEEGGGGTGGGGL